MRQLTSLKLISLIIAIVMVLAGCGGSVTVNGNVCGFDYWGNPIYCQVNPPLPPLPTPVASTSTFALAQGVSNVVNTSYTFTVNAQDTYGNIYTIQNSSAPGPSTTFQSLPANTTGVTQFYFENGFTTLKIYWTNYYSASPFQPLGAVANFAGSPEIVNSYQAPPTTATVGQQFPSLTATLYHDSSYSVVDGTLTETVGLAANTASTALLCFTDTVQLTQAGINDNLYAGTTSNCYVIDTAGNITGMQITAPVGYGTMLFY